MTDTATIIAGAALVVAVANAVYGRVKDAKKDYMPREVTELRFKRLEDEVFIKWSSRWHDDIAPVVQTHRLHEFLQREKRP